MPTTYPHPAASERILERRILLTNMIDPAWTEFHYKLELDLTLTAHRGSQWATRDHCTIDHFTELSIVGGAYRRQITGTRWEEDSFGQIHGWARTLLHWEGTAQSSEMLRLYDIWERWGTNGLNAGCIHQGKLTTPNDVRAWWYPQHQAQPEWKRSIYGLSAGRADKAVWDVEQAYWTARCPEGYRYGSKWLVDELPADVTSFLEGL